MKIFILRQFTLVILLMSWSHIIWAQIPGELKVVVSDTLKSETIAERIDTLRLDDDPTVARFDSMLVQSFRDYYKFTADTSLLNFKNFEPKEIPTYSSEVMKLRMEFIDGLTPMELDYNSVVQQYIDLYTKKSKMTSSRMLGASEKFFPMFEELLDKHGLPQELKYLAIIESALNPSAKSPVGAAGLWQFMVGTAKECGLEVNSYVDERLDAYKSTEAACIYLKRLYSIYDDWSLALAAYNSGPGNVNKAIRRAGGVKNFWAIRPHLPRETSSYVPAFIAVNYVMAYASEHNIYPVEPEYTYFEIDTLKISKMLRMDQVAAFTDLTVEELISLNPCYTKGVIPISDHSNNLYLPISAVGDFLTNEEKIYNYKKEVKPTFVPKENLATTTSTENKKQITYKVRSGDVLGIIADNHNVGVSQLRSWNGIKGNRIYPGQKLKIWVNDVQGSTAQKQTTSKPKPVPEYESGYQYHTVKNGDTLWDIAKLYDDVDYYDLKDLNSDINIRRLKLGQKIKIKKIG